MGQVLLGEPDELLKPCGVFNRHVREDLAIEGDIGFLECVDESPIRHSLCANGRADASDPQLAEVSLPVLTTRVGIGQSFINTFRRRSEQPAFSAVLA